jgi:chromate transporter
MVNAFSTPAPVPSADLSKPAPANARTRPTLPEMARAFVAIGCLAFGGQGGLLALLSRDLVQRRGWTDEAEIAEAFTYVQLLPGAVVVQVVAYLGYRLRRWSGAATATFCFLLPSVAAMFLFAAAYRTVVAAPGVPAALHGLTSAVVGLIALAAWKQARKTVKDSLGVVIAVGVCAASALRHVNPAVLVVAAGAIGLVREANRREEPGSGKPAANTEEVAAKAEEPAAKAEEAAAKAEEAAAKAEEPAANAGEAAANAGEAAP